MAYGIMLQIIIDSISEQKKKKIHEYGQCINNVIRSKSKEGLLLSDNTGKDLMKEEAFICDAGNMNDFSTKERVRTKTTVGQFVPELSGTEDRLYHLSPPLFAFKKILS